MNNPIPSQEAKADPELQNSGFKHFDTKCPESGLKCGYWIRYYSERAKEFEAERHILAKRVHDQRLEIVRLEALRPPTPAADQQTELEAVNELTKDWQWTVISPDGRQWIGETAFRAASKAHRETITPEQAANVLATLQSEQARADAEMVAEHEHLNCPACGGSGHVDDVPASLAACFAGGSPARDVEALAAINQDLIDAKRYRWLRDRAIWRDPPNADGDMVWCVIGPSALDCDPCDGDELDSAIDERLAAGPIEGEGV